VTSPSKSALPQNLAQPAEGPIDAAPSVSLSATIEQVMGRFETRARQLARLRRVDAAEVDDVLQDVRIKLWQTPSIRENLERLPTSYLVKVLTSVIIDRVRRRRTSNVQLEALADGANVPETLRVQPVETGVPHDTARHLAAALRTLPANRRVLVELHLAGYDRQEMVRMTGWSEAKVRNLLYRGLENLRAAMTTNRENADD
jgi:RNA polymerase sigma-70 factor (ECF subfamily)